jgi:hypothetical protein
MGSSGFSDLDAPRLRRLRDAGGDFDLDQHPLA